MVDKNRINCNLCGSDRHDLIYPDELGDQIAATGYDFSERTRRTYAIVRCSSCGLVFCDPMPSLSAAYVNQVDSTYLRSEAQRQITAKRSVAALRRFVPGGRLLDIGCATGIFLDAASAYFSVEGIELSRWAAEIAGRKHLVHTCPLAKFPQQAEYDVATLWGVIEHFEDPIAELRAIHRLLNPGGLIVIYTGDIDSWLPRLLGKKWWWFQGMHIYYFSLKSLTKMLERVGFEVVFNDLLTVDFQLFSLGISLRRYRIGGLLAPLLNIPLLRNICIPLRLSGEMVVYARKKQGT